MPLIAGVFVLTCSVALSSSAEDWKMADEPLVTRWAKDVSPTNALPEYPRPQMVRKEWMNLNGLWDYAIVRKDDAQPEKFDGKILVPYPIESTLSGVMKRVGETNRLWYHRTFELPVAYARKRVLLHFGAVDWETSIIVNGKPIGAHRGGYDAFNFDITDALKPTGPQEIVVSVWDPTNAGPQPRGKQVNKPGGIFYTPVTGIWQTVWLEPVNAVRVVSLKITPDLDGSKVTIEPELLTAKGKIGLKISIQDDGNEMPLVDWTIEGTGADRLLVPIIAPLQHVKPWSPEAPTLYGLRITVSMEGKDIDSIDSYFAMRKISLGKDDKGITRPMLNNKFVFQMGPLDQGFWPDGIYTAPTDEALKYDIEVTKQLGFNMTRKHVKVEPDRWYYWCDKLGLLVWQDMPAGDKGVGSGKGEIQKDPVAAKEFEGELKSMIDGLRNHPCIVQWVVFNEGWGQYNTVRLTDWVKQYDPTRLVDCASGWNDMNCGDMHDMHKYPAPGMFPAEEKRASVLGEYGGLGLFVDGHMWEARKNKSWGYQGMKTPQALTNKYLAFAKSLSELQEKGLSAAVYTQITDVETESNGLLTYDRAVIKPDAQKIAAANRFKSFEPVEEPPPPPIVPQLVPTAETIPSLWKYTTETPGAEWLQVDFDATAWKEGKNGFGTEGTPGAIIGTEWRTNDIWLRREVTLPDRPLKNPRLSIHHDDDVEVYLNGVLAFKAKGYLGEYQEKEITPEGLKALKAGKNVIAVHCHQFSGGQYVDVGIVEDK